MEKSLKEAKNKYHVGLGDYHFSPIIEITTAITLDYCESVKNNGIKSRTPLFFCFPEKKAASLWLSINLLTNYYLEEYVSNSNDDTTTLENGDLVNVYGSILKFIRIAEDKIILASNDGVHIQFESKNRKHLTKVENRTPNNHSHYKQNRNEARTNRNSISKILEPNEPVIINTNHLKSKILLIAGRGNIGSIRSLLKNVQVYDEPLSKAFPENENLIIKPDLESFKDVFSSNSKNTISDFIVILKKLEEITKNEDLKSQLVLLNEKYNQEKTITDQFNAEFERIIEEYIGLEPKLDFVKKKYPGVQEGLPENLKAVIINDISQIIDYPGTIKGFLNAGIPVIFTSNRKLEKVSEIEFYQQLFNQYQDCYRINWNKKKILSFDQMLNEKFIDKDFWKQCVRYANQKINIEISDGNALDQVMPLLGKEMGKMDEFESLQTSFNRFLNPAYYAIKNSRSSNESIQKLIIEFEITYNKVRNSGVNKSVREALELAIDTAKSFENNTKWYSDDENIFTATFLSPDESKIFIPIEAHSVFVPSSKNDSVTFSGFPYREYSGHYLWDSLCVYFITNIKILCWPNEAKLTENYIRRRLLAGYFTDNIVGVSSFVGKEYLLNDKNDFDEEIKSFFAVDHTNIKGDDITVEGDEQERNLEYLHALIYKGYSSNSLRKDFKVKCNIVNFTNGSFLFLPQGNGGKILSEVENSNGKIGIRELKFNELTVGLKVYKYKKDRSTYKEIASHNMDVKEAFAKLDFWKESLERLYHSLGSDIDRVETLLMETKFKNGIEGGNPIKSNIQMWLFDDEKISPRVANLEIILRAAQVDDLEIILLELEMAYKVIVNGFYMRLNRTIKNSIMKQLSIQKHDNEKMTVNLDGTEIEVESSTIMALEKSEIEIDYQNTRKILC
jgi:hypothetical protein